MREREGEGRKRENKPEERERTGGREGVCALILSPAVLSQALGH